MFLFFFRPGQIKGSHMLSLLECVQAIADFYSVMYIDRKSILIFDQQFKFMF